MSEFFRVCKTSDVPDPGREVIEVNNHLIVLIHLNGKYYALDDACTHKNGPLGEGILENHQIICPCHGARFDVRTGRSLTMPAISATQVHEVKVEGNDVFVRIITS
jgi:3-phenylpropionate/trans-cinnamate dioxygenase ferredoxin subunit